MSRSTIRNRLTLDSNEQPVQTGSWFSAPINIDEHRRLSISGGITSATGTQTGTAYPDCGSYTGTLVVQGTDELAQYSIPSGAPFAGTRSPGTANASGAMFWQTIPSGTYAVTKATQVFALNFTDVGFAYVRVGFNVTGGITGAWAPSATGCLGGSGTWNVFLTAKNT
jgi:hypothetical protein